MGTLVVLSLPLGTRSQGSLAQTPRSRGLHQPPTALYLPHLHQDTQGRTDRRTVAELAALLGRSTAPAAKAVSPPRPRPAAAATRRPRVGPHGEAAPGRDPHARRPAPQGPPGEPRQPRSAARSTSSPRGDAGNQREVTERSRHSSAPDQRIKDLRASVATGARPCVASAGPGPSAVQPPPRGPAPRRPARGRVRRESQAPRPRQQRTRAIEPQRFVLEQPRQQFSAAEVDLGVSRGGHLHSLSSCSHSRLSASCSASCPRSFTSRYLITKRTSSASKTWELRQSLSASTGVAGVAPPHRALPESTRTACATLQSNGTTTSPAGRRCRRCSTVSSDVGLASSPPLRRVPAITAITTARRPGSRATASDSLPRSRRRGQWRRGPPTWIRTSCSAHDLLHSNSVEALRPAGVVVDGLVHEVWWRFSSGRARRCGRRHLLW